MDVRTHKSRARSLSPFRQGSEFRQIEQDISLKDGDLAVRKAQSAVEVAPGGIVDVSLEVINGALSILGPEEPDCCGPDCNVGEPSPFNGYEYRLKVKPDWVDTTEYFETTDCIMTTEAGVVKHPYGRPELSWEAPNEQGTRAIEIVLEGAGGDVGGGVSGSTTLLVDICAGCPTRPGANQCISDEDCPSNDCDTETNECVPANGGGGFLDDIQIILALVIVIALFLKFG